MNYDGSIKGNDTVNLGSKIKRKRLQEQMTLQMLADRSCCSKSMLSKIENSNVNPSIATLSRIAKALNIPLSSLLDENDEPMSVFTPASQIDAKSFITSETGYDYLSLAASFMDNSMTPLLVRGKKGKVVKHEMVHNGEEFIMVLHGEMRFYLDDKTYIMKEHDSVYFNATQKHGMLPISDEVEYIDIVL